MPGKGFEVWLEDAVGTSAPVAFQPGFDRREHGSDADADQHADQGTADGVGRCHDLPLDGCDVGTDPGENQGRDRCSDRTVGREQEQVFHEKVF